MVQWKMGWQTVVEYCRLHVTPLLLGSLPTVAVNGCVPADCTFADVGAIEIVIPRTVIVAGADAALLVTELAVSVTLKFLAGAITGAV